MTSSPKKGVEPLPYSLFEGLLRAFRKAHIPEASVKEAENSWNWMPLLGTICSSGKARQRSTKASEKMPLAERPLSVFAGEKLTQKLRRLESLPHIGRLTER